MTTHTRVGSASMLFELALSGTWCGKAVLPSGFVVIQGLQHDVHGKSKQAPQEEVENYVEQNDET